MRSGDEKLVSSGAGLVIHGVRYPDGDLAIVGMESGESGAHCAPQICHSVERFPFPASS